MMDYRNIDDVDKTMDEINEQTENMKQIQEALSTPIGSAADFDEVSVSQGKNLILSIPNPVMRVYHSKLHISFHLEEHLSSWIFSG